MMNLKLFNIYKIIVLSYLCIFINIDLSANDKIKKIRNYTHHTKLGKSTKNKNLKNKKNSKKEKLKFFNKRFDNYSLDLSNLHTTSHEYVYNSNRKLSELIWDSKDSKLLGYSVDYLLNYNSYIAFSYKTNIYDGKTTMNDYDWIDDDNPTIWSDWSNHPNTILNSFNILDVSLNNKINLYKNSKQYLLVGYKQEYKQFQAYDGSYIYSPRGTIDRNETGNFSGLTITYSEEYKGIYLGLRNIHKYKNITFLETLKYSPFMEGQNSDTHHLRYFTNNNTFNNITMINLDLESILHYSKNINIKLGYNYTKYAKQYGYTTRTYYDGATEETPGTVLRYSGAAIQNQYTMITISLLHRF